MPYPSDLNNTQWEIICPYFENSSNDRRGAKPTHEKRTIINAILYVTRGGIPWRMMPNDFPPYKTVYDHYRNWCLHGIWEKILDKLVETYREQVGRNTKPSYGIIDSQSVKTQYASEDRGYDGGKKSER